MTKAPSDTLVLAGTGKTGRRLAAKLAKLGLSVRTAARNGADVHFDWDDATTHRAALQGSIASTWSRRSCEWTSLTR